MSDEKRIGIIKMITAERVDSADAYRAQVHFEDRRIVYASFYGPYYSYQNSFPASVRDKHALEILGDLIAECRRKAAADPSFLRHFQNFMHTMVHENIRTDVLRCVGNNAPELVKGIT